MTSPAGSIDSAAREPRERNPALDALRIAAVLGVVAIHVSGGLVTNPEIRGSASWWAAVAVNSGSIWVVPAFVMVSGALLLGPRAQGAGPAAFYRKRLVRLGPAFVFWQLFYIVLVRMVISGTDLTPKQVIASILAGSPYTHLYFLYLIVGLYAIAPVLAAFLRAGGERRAWMFAGIVLAATVGTYTVASLLGYSMVLTAFTQWVPYVGYFLAGWALRSVVLRGGWLAVAVVATLAVLVEIVWQAGTRAEHPTLNTILPLHYLGLATTLAAIGVFLVFQGVFARLPLSPRVKAVLAALSDAAFGVFLIHFVIMILVRLAFAQFTDSVTTSIWTNALIWLTVVVLSFAISLGARRVPYLRRLF